MSSNSDYEEFIRNRLKELNGPTESVGVEVGEDEFEEEFNEDTSDEDLDGSDDVVAESPVLPIVSVEDRKYVPEFPEWDILKEIDRRTKRKARDKEKNDRIREYMKAHPDVVEKLRKQHGLA